LATLLFANGSFVVKCRLFWKQFDTVTVNSLLKIQGLIKPKYLCIFKGQKRKTAKLNSWVAPAIIISSNRQPSQTKVRSQHNVILNSLMLI